MRRLVAIALSIVCACQEPRQPHGEASTSAIDHTTVQRACRNVADCAAQAGGHVDADQCVSDSEQALEYANEAGCGQELAAYISCAANAACNSEYGLLTSCNPDFDTYGECVGVE